uniref:Transmembrane protein 235 n=1 Tax=Cyclopterus lumpus TaxID=8103 RepID=A0A8C2ZLZ0_CYCLU
MKLTFGALVIAAGVCGILSFAFLATSLGTEYWYIIEMNPLNMSDFEDLSSHSGLWSIHEGRGSESLSTHSANQVLVLLLFGGICGLVSSMARSPVLLTRTACYFFICSLLTLCGVSLYIIYSYQALAETERVVGPEGLAYIHTSFGWSLGLACLSYGLELLTGSLSPPTVFVAWRTATFAHKNPG